MFSKNRGNIVYFPKIRIDKNVRYDAVMLSSYVEEY